MSSRLPSLRYALPSPPPLERGSTYALTAPDPGARARFLSEADCHDIVQRLARYAAGGGTTEVYLVSRWRGYVRWARNQIISAGEDRDTHLRVSRHVNGSSSGDAQINDLSDEALVAAARQCERLVRDGQEQPGADLDTRPGSPLQVHPEPVAVPPLFFESTYQLDAAQRAAAAQQLMQQANTAGMLSAGYIEVSATSFAGITSWGWTRYCQYTWARYTNTVRDPKGQGSGWAGVDWPDWSKIDGPQLAAIALDKCLKSRNPVAIEPGRYTTILEPQAVCDFLSPYAKLGIRVGAEQAAGAYFNKIGKKEPYGFARFGEKVIDERLTFKTDPLDPMLSFPPTAKNIEHYYYEYAYHPATWIERGILKQLPYVHDDYPIVWLGQNTQLTASGAFQLDVEGPTTSVDEMIATTKRGIVVTRFDSVVDQSIGGAWMVRGYTRDGLWLVEDGKISKPVKNLMFFDEWFRVLNNVEQVGAPQRCFHPGSFALGPLEWRFDPTPVVAPALKVKDFAFTALSNAV